MDYPQGPGSEDWHRPPGKPHGPQLLERKMECINKIKNLQIPRELFTSFVGLSFDLKRLVEYSLGSSDPVDKLFEVLDTRLSQIIITHANIINQAHSDFSEFFGNITRIEKLFNEAYNAIESHFKLWSATPNETFHSHMHIWSAMDRIATLLDMSNSI
jgi:hypothetical protein